MERKDLHLSGKNKKNKSRMLNAQLPSNVAIARKLRLSRAQSSFSFFPSLTITKLHRRVLSKSKPNRDTRYDKIRYISINISRHLKSLAKTNKFYCRSSRFRLFSVNKKSYELEDVQVVNAVVLKQELNKMMCFIASGSVYCLRSPQSLADESFIFITEDFSLNLIELIGNCKNLRSKSIAEHCLFTLQKKHNMIRLNPNKKFLTKHNRLIHNSSKLLRMPLLLEVPIPLLKKLSFKECPVIDISELKDRPLQFSSDKEQFFYSPTYNTLPAQSENQNGQVIQKFVHFNTHSYSTGTFNINNEDSSLEVNGSFLACTAGSLLFDENGRPAGILDTLIPNSYSSIDSQLNQPLFHVSALKNKAYPLFSPAFLNLSSEFLNLTK